METYLWKINKDKLKNTNIAKYSNFINYDKFEKYLDFGGIRIEDNVLITNHKSENLSEFIIKEVDDIESIMN